MPYFWFQSLRIFFFWETLLKIGYALLPLANSPDISQINIWFTKLHTVLRENEVLSYSIRTPVNNRHFATPLLVFLRNGVWGTTAKTPHWGRVTTQMLVLLLTCCTTWEICFNQSEELPRTALWHVTSMEFLKTFLRRHFAGKPIVEMSAVFSG